MKIAFYNVTATSIHGGLETYCWEVGRALARRGHVVSIIAGNRGDARYQEINLQQFSYRPEKEWPDFGVRFRRLAERLSFAMHSMECLISGEFDLVIVNKPFDFPILWRARCLGMHAQTLFRSGGTDFFPGDRRFANAIDHWVSSSHYNAAQVRGRYGRDVRVIHNGVDIESFQPVGRDPSRRAELGASEEDVILVSVGRLVGWKGIRIVLDAIAELPKNLHLVVIGTGSEEQTLRDRAKVLGLDRRVHFAGHVDHAELPKWLVQCDLFVQPSIGEEAFGISVVEAMACGLPVLASNNGGLPEIVVNGETGLLLSPGDVPVWRDSILDLMKRKDRLNEMGTAGRLRAERHFSWAANAQKHEDMLQVAKCAAS